MKGSLKKVMILTMLIGTMGVSQKLFAHEVFAPYVDITLSDVPELEAISKEMDIERYQLGFIVADKENEPSWGSVYDLREDFIEDQIKALDKEDIEVGISFGGAKGKALQIALEDEEDLVDAIDEVVDRYEPASIDFDIEGEALKDLKSARRLVRALETIKGDYEDLEVWFTLPVSREGLTSEGLAIMDYAIDRDLEFEGVHLMTMNYGAHYTEDMADLVIESAQNVFNQLDDLYDEADIRISESKLWEQIGIVPMIGVNDTYQVFELEDAQKIVDFAKEVGIEHTSFWSLSRDKQGALGYVTPTSSGIRQEPLAFTKIFAGYEALELKEEIKVDPVGPYDVMEESIFFTWDQIKEARYYEIYRDGLKIDEIDEEEFTDQNLRSNTEYRYSIIAIDKKGEPIAKSKTFSIKTDRAEGDVETPDIPVANDGTWQPGIDYRVGDKVTYKEKMYQCITPHRALNDWQPEGSHTLWVFLPEGKEDANGTTWADQVVYKRGDVVIHNGKRYSCIQPHTSNPGWTPDATPALWGLYEN